MGGNKKLGERYRDLSVFCFDLMIEVNGFYQCLVKQNKKTER